MKKIVISACLVFFAAFCAAQNVVDTDKDIVTCFVGNPNSFEVKDAPVVLRIMNPKFNSAIVLEGKNEVPSQFDILDGGTLRELSFVTDMKAKHRKMFRIIFSESPQDMFAYKPRVNAQMFLKENGVIVPKDVVASDSNNMYNRLHHHGPAFESELAAYRLYFDHKQTVDIYGKVIPRIELPETMWYPSDSQLVAKYGDDVLYVGNSVGLGTLKGWDGQRAQHVTDMSRREMRLIAKGPVRAIVDLNVEGWKTGGKTIDLNSRYTIYAGHRDVDVCYTFTGDTEGLKFATGVQRIRKGDVMYSDSRGTVADWGCDFPVNDTVKYPQQTVGLAVTIPPQYVVSETSDNLSYLYILKPDAANSINYRIVMAAEKEEFGYKNSDGFFEYVARWSGQKPVDITVRVR